jgi:hypothetical protein
MLNRVGMPMSLVADREINLRQIALWHGLERRGNERLVLAREPVDPVEWDQLAAGFDGAVQEQLYAYAATRWPSARPEPLIFRSGGEVVGGALMMVQSLPLGVGSIAVCKWGPIFKDAAHREAPAIYSAMIDSLIAEYAVERGMMLSVLPRAATSSQNWQYDHLIARRFRKGASLLFPNRYIVNVGLSDEAQRKSFEQKWRYHLNKSEKAGLSFEHAEAERLGEFDVLYHAMTDRKNFADHSAYQTIPALLAAGPAQLRPELFFVRHEGELVAGAVIFKAGDTAVYLFGATNAKALPLRAGYFMHANIIRWLRDNTPAKWYDLGGTDGFQGLHQFKKGMVGAAGVISTVPPVANYAARPLALLAGEGAFAARDTYYALRRWLEVRFSGKAKPNQARPEDNGAEG